jgi:DNA-directed RNA polymerase subunit omega
MKTQYIEKAAEVVTNKQQLVNIISKRVRELSAGSRPMIDADLSMGLADIALAEIAAGKLGTAVSPLSGDGIPAF